MRIEASDAASGRRLASLSGPLFSSIAFAVDDDLLSIVGGSIQCIVGEDFVIEERNLLIDVPIAGDRPSTMQLKSHCCFSGTSGDGDGRDRWWSARAMEGG